MDKLGEQFIAQARFRGAEGDRWLADLPNLVAHYERKWSFAALDPFPLNYNYVAPVRRSDGTQAVLKIAFPGDDDFRSEINALNVFAGTGCAALLAVDRPNSVALIERVMPGRPLSSIEDDSESARAVADVMRRLHKPLPADHAFKTIADWAKSIPEYQSRFGSDGPLPGPLVARASGLFDELIATSVEPMLVHGDLHQDNVLWSDTHGWTAIDPKGIAGEPAYDVAAMIRNPYERLRDVADLRPILENRLTVLSDELGFDRTRLLEWCLAQTVLSAVWNVDGTKGYEHALRVAEVLDSMLEVVS